MILINNVNLPLNTDFSQLTEVAAKSLFISKDKVKSATLYKKSVDARKKYDVHFCCSLLVDLNISEEVVLKKQKNAIIFNEKKYIFKKASKTSEKRPIVIGFGPAGMFSALTLARAGLNPIVFERGKSADERQKDVNLFMNGGKLNTESNVQFGEGGAGTFSDGKLNTGTKDARLKTVIKTFYEFGASEKILTDAKPHIGTDILINVVKNIRKEIISLGGEVNFNSRLENIKISDNKVISITVNGKEIFCDDVILAIGHSARDTFKMLKDVGLNLEKKPFSMGVRIEHLQEDVNKSLYGSFYDNPSLNAADYKLAVHLKNGRGVYTFCMCPGGEVINSSSENNMTAINGMSYSARDGKNANSAVLVGVNPEDFGNDDVLAGLELQRKIEKKAYDLCSNSVPVTTVDNFVYGKPFKITKVEPTVKPNYQYADFNNIFPKFIIESLKDGIKMFSNKLDFFRDGAAVLTAPETRSSSPVRIVRDEFFNSINVKGIYPSGEGAGYAGGIVSSAVDGMKCAEAIINLYE